MGHAGADPECLRVLTLWVGALRRYISCGDRQAAQRRAVIQVLGPHRLTWRGLLVHAKRLSSSDTCN